MNNGISILRSYAIGDCAVAPNHEIRALLEVVHC